MDETNEVETEASDTNVNETGEFLTTAVVFGAGALSAAVLPRVWRGVKTSARNVNEGVKARIELRKLNREQNTEEK